MDRTSIYALLVLVVCGSCLLVYGGARLISRYSRSTQWWIAILGICACLIGFSRPETHWIATNCLVLFGALFFGIWLSGLIGSSGALSTFLVTAAIVDFISTRVGPSRWLVGQPHIVQYLAVTINLKGRMIPVIGIGDLMFFAVCVLCTRRQGWSETAALAIPLAALVSALCVGLAYGFTPALPFLAVAVVVYGRATVEPRAPQSAGC